MTASKRFANMFVVALGLPVLVLGVRDIARGGVTLIDVVLFATLYFVTAAGITVGYHRFFTHRAFSAGPVVTALLAIAGSMAIQGPILEWVSDHRCHHASSDAEGDPHSPVGHGSGFWSVLRGFYHAHVGWLGRTQGSAEPQRYARDLLEIRSIRVIDKMFGVFALLGLALPFAVGYLVDGMQGAWGGLLWGGAVRMVVQHHVTFSVNSVCHIMGSKEFDVRDQSGNVGWLALPTLGESWHHNHHAFPRSAVHGLRWWQVDLSAGFIKLLAALRLVDDVIVVEPQQLAARRARAAERVAR